MPLIDMPVEELVRYQGINPCPPDMDTFWDEAVREMHTIDPRVELVPSAFQVPYASMPNICAPSKSVRPIPALSIFMATASTREAGRTS